MRKPIQIKRHDTKENHRQQQYEASEKKFEKARSVWMSLIYALYGLTPDEIAIVEGKS